MAENDTRKSFCLTYILFFYLTFVNLCSGIRFSGGEGSYAQYSKWDACQQSQISFEFKTARGNRDGLLFYMDDRSRSDFILMKIQNGQLRVEMKFVDGGDDGGTVDLVKGSGLDNNRWHSVELIRNRMQTMLLVDKHKTEKTATGSRSDFNFGQDVSSNSPLYFGGVPEDLHARELTRQEVRFERRFQGEIRNLLYKNCSCRTTRAVFEKGKGVSQERDEPCDRTGAGAHTCSAGCLCVTTRRGSGECDCTEQNCEQRGVWNHLCKGQRLCPVTHYYLPMNNLVTQELYNDAGLDAIPVGDPALIAAPGLPGNKALQMNGQKEHLEISGKVHRLECFGDLDLCPKGYTVAMWLKFVKSESYEISYDWGVYMSNGGHTTESHGIAMLYRPGHLQFRFRNKAGMEWRVESNNVLIGRWYHVAATWDRSIGLQLYVNGDWVALDNQPRKRGVVDPNYKYNKFVLGRANDNRGTGKLLTITVDEFQFWDTYLDEREIRENGPFYRHFLLMESLIAGKVEPSSKATQASIYGNPRFVDGRHNKGLSLSGNREYISLGDVRDTCLGNLAMCKNGITISSWVMFDHLSEDMYFLANGNGTEIFYKGGALHAVFRAQTPEGIKKWEATWDGVQRGIWYLLDVTWHPKGGLRMYVNNVEVAYLPGTGSRTSDTIQTRYPEFYIGRANSPMLTERYGAMSLDNFEVWYGERDSLISMNLISRGPPKHFLFGFDAMIGDQVYHPNRQMKIHAHNEPRIIKGKVGNAIWLDGREQYARLNYPKKEPCLGNVDVCFNGNLVTFWLRPIDFKDKRYILDTGLNGIVVTYTNGKLLFEYQTTTRTWSVETSDIYPDKWYFVELSMNPDTGLELYVNTERIAEDSNPEVRDIPRNFQYTKDIDRFYVGRGNTEMTTDLYANATFDELEFWYAPRDYLLANNYIIRGKPQHYFIDFDEVRFNRLVHETLNIQLGGNPVNVEGRLKKALLLNGNNQYADIGDHSTSCLGNLNMCRHGYYLGTWINFRDMRDNTYYMSTGPNGIQVFSRGGKLYVEFHQQGKMWQVVLDGIEPNKWQYLEFSWHPDKGLSVWLDNQKVGHSPMITVQDSNTGSEISRFFLGRANPGDTRNFRYANVIFDDMDIWYSTREDLIAFGYIQRGKYPYESFSFEYSDGNKVLHPRYDVILENGAVLTDGRYGNSVILNGRQQSVTLKDVGKTCMGNLEKCKHGLTLSLWLNPKQIEDNTYFLSSDAYKLYTKNGRLYASFHTPTKTWIVSTSGISRDQWHLIDLSWHPDKGLEMWLNDRKVDSTTEYTTRPDNGRRNPDVLIGRTDTYMINERYANAKIDELRYWYAPRDALIAFDYIDKIPYTNDSVTFDVISGNRVIHPTRTIFINGRPETVTGVWNNAIYLKGPNDYVDFGNNLTCKGNLENCYNGFTFRFLANPKRLEDNQYFVSSNPITVYYKDGEMHAVYNTPTQTWKVSAPGITTDKWQLIEYSWDKEHGLVMFVDKKKVAQSINPTIRIDTDNPNQKFQIGRPHTSVKVWNPVNAQIDDVEFVENKIWKLWGDNLLRYPEAPTPTPPAGPDIRVIYPSNDAWIRYYIDQLPRIIAYPQNDRETLNVRFKTDNPNGLLWYTTNEKREIRFSLKDGAVFLEVIFPDGTRESIRLPHPRGTFADNIWHDAVITRDGRLVTLNVDNRYRTNQRFSRDFRILDGGTVYLGGSLDNNGIYTGTIDEFIINGNRMRDPLDLLNVLIKEPLPGFIDPNKVIIWVDGRTFTFPPRATPTPPIPSPVTFRFPEAYVTSQSPRFDRGDKIELTITTVEPHGLLLYNPSDRGTDFFAVELYDGYAWLVVGAGNRVTREKFSDDVVNDGQPHTLKIERSFRGFDIEQDGRAKSVRVRNLANINLGQRLYIGGYPNTQALPWHVWSRKGYVGCLSEMRVKDDYVNVKQLGDRQRAPLEVGCISMPTDCRTRPCQNGGICRERFDGHKCDCTNTDYTDINCLRRAPEAGFDGTREVRVTVSPYQRTHVDDFALRFVTQKPNGVLFSTVDSRSNKYFKVELENGRAKLSTNLNGRDKVIYAGNNLNNNQWHTVHARRRANNIELWVDDGPRVSDVIPDPDGYTLNFNEVEVGMPQLRNPDKSFIGYIKLLEFNGLDIPLPEGPYRPIQPITFRTKPAYIRIRDLTDRDVEGMSFLFRTNQSNGLMLYNDGPGNVFYAIQLQDGRLNLAFDNGRSGPTIITSSKGNLNDNEWHKVEIQRLNEIQHTLNVDGVQRRFRADPQTANAFRFQGGLYLGGVPENIYRNLPVILQTGSGFQGCFGDLILASGQSRDLVRAAAGQQHVDVGCLGPAVVCRADTCLHGGICEERNGQPYCDCSRTGYIGKACENLGPGWQFGPNPTVLVHRFPPGQRPDTELDQIGIGFMTEVPDGILLRSDGEGSDFIEIRLVDGRLVFTYDIGNGVKTLTEDRVRFDDRRYHYIKVDRDKKTATLQVDGFAPKKIQPGPRDVFTLFNRLKEIKVGGNLSPRNEVLEPFFGVISGFFYNGIVPQWGQVGEVHPIGPPYVLPVTTTTTPTPIPKNNPPGKVNRFEVTSTTTDCVDVFWLPPTYIGDGAITGYSLAIKDARGSWRSVRPVDARTNRYQFCNLEAGSSYMLRVIPTNIHGPGEPSVITASTQRYALPGSPRNTRIVEVKSDYGVVSWQPPLTDGGTPVTGYKVDLRERGGNVILTRNLPRNIRVFRFENLNPETTYDVRVFAINAVGTGTPGQDHFVTEKVLTAPSPPRELRPRDVTTNSFVVTWSPPVDNGGSAITGYEVYTRDLTTNRWRKIGNTLSSNIRLLKIENLDQGQFYCVRVFAINDIGRSNPAEMDPCVKTKVPPKEPPGIPRNIIVSNITQESVSMFWEAPSWDGGSPITAYEIETLDYATNRWTRPITVGSTVRNKILPGLKEGAQYRFRIRARNVVGPGQYAVTPNIQLKAAEPPRPVRNLKATDLEALPDGNVDVTISWEPPIFDGGSPLTSYIVDRYDRRTGIRYGTDRLSPENLQTTLKGLKRNALYEIRVYAANVKGVSPERSLNLNTTVGIYPPSPPRNLIVFDVSNEGMTLNWDAPFYDGGKPITHYPFQYRDILSNVWVPVENVDAPKTSIVVKNLQTGHRYYFRVAAVNEAGSSTFTETSDAVEYKIIERAPGKPQNFHVYEKDGNSVIVSWSEPLFDGGAPISGYFIDKRDSTGQWTNAGRVTADQDRFKIQNLLEQHSYFFRVKAFNRVGPGEAAELDTAVNIGIIDESPTPPKNPHVTSRDETTMKIGWKEPTWNGGSPLTKYIIDIRPGDSTTWTRTFNVLAGETTYTLTNLKGKKAYCFRIKAVNAKNKESAYEVLEECVPWDVESPYAPTFVRPLALNYTGKTITVGWRKPPFDGGSPIIEYVIQIKDTEDNKWRNVGTAEAGVFSKIIEDLIRDHSYYIRVAAKNKKGRGSFTEHPDVISLVKPIQVPSAPRGLIVQTVEDGLIPSWGAPAFDGGSAIIDYLISTRLESENEYGADISVGSGDIFEYHLTGLEGGKKYFVRVKAVNTAGTSTPAAIEIPVEFPIWPLPATTAPPIIGGVGGGGGGVAVGVKGGGGGVPVGIGAGSGPGGGAGVIGLAEAPPAAAAVTSPGAGGYAGPLAGALAAGLVGLLLLGSAIGWALYKCKPGMIPFGGGKTGGAAITAPAGAKGAGVGTGAGGAAENVFAGIGGAGGNRANAISIYDAANADFADGAYYGAGSGGSAAGGYGTGSGYGAGGTGMFSSETMQTTSYEQTMMGNGGYAQGYAGSRAGSVAGGYAGNMGASQQNLQAGGYGTMSSSAYNYNMESNMQQNTGIEMMGVGVGSSHGVPVPFLTLSEEIKVDTCLLTNNGQYVVTGSCCGPPQIWDMSNGELVRIMRGDDLASTDLHLASQDTMMVGQVSAEPLHVDMNDVQAGNHIPYRKLQIWDFDTGRPMDMPLEQLCTASCMMSDGERIALARTDRYGNSTSVIIYDLIANQALQELKYEGAIGIADSVSTLMLSPDNRYAVAGFHNSYDGNANFIVFDLVNGYNIEPKILALDAEPECTVILDNHEAVTGTRKGELTIWSLRTGKALRQLITSGDTQTMGRGGSSTTIAHTREVKAVALSADGKHLVSASADGTLKVWNTETEKLEHTLRGHTDEVWCAAISNDNDFIVSGSRDCTIRLWRLRSGSEICNFYTGIDVFTVKISNDKKTIVALGDKFASRKLIMLQIVHSKGSRR